MFRLNTTREWLKKAAELEEGFDVSVGHDFALEKRSSNENKQRKLFVWERIVAMQEDIEDVSNSEGKSDSFFADCISRLHKYACQFTGDKQAAMRLVRETLISAFEEVKDFEDAGPIPKPLLSRLQSKIAAAALRSNEERYTGRGALQWEVSNLLKAEGFRINAPVERLQNRFCRSDVDICAEVQMPLSGFGKGKTTFLLLAKCIVQSFARKWVFLPQVKEERVKHSCVLRTIDAHPMRAFGKTTCNLKLSHAFNGLEIDTAYGIMDGNRQLQESITSLRYALPLAMYDFVETNVAVAPEKRLPFTSCAIVVSGSPLYMINESVSFREFGNLHDIHQIAKEVPYLAFHSDYGPHFASYCKGAFRHLRHADVRGIGDFKGRSPFRYPNSEALAHAMAEGTTEWLGSLFTGFIICHHERLGSLVTALKKAASERPCAAK